MLSEKENTYLARWINDELSPEELEQFKQLPEYEEFEKIAKGIRYFHAPNFETQKSLATTLDRLRKKKKVIKLKPFIYAMAVAASILLIIGLFFNTVTYTTTPGKQLSVILPDGSDIIINAGSTITRSRFFWSQQRTVSLEGEAFFKVTSGNTFIVQLNSGKVAVLGTSFNIKSRKENVEVACYEGKVSVATHHNPQKILIKGDVITFDEKQLKERRDTASEPLWIKGKSVFDSVPLYEVILALERQYPVHFTVHTAIDKNKRFTGAFFYNNLKVALKSVFIPMGIDYSIHGDIITLSLK